jgi:hypothetical protein
MADDTGLGAAARALRGAQPGRDALTLQIPGDGSVRHLPCSTVRESLPCELRRAGRSPHLLSFERG